MTTSSKPMIVQCAPYPMSARALPVRRRRWRKSRRISSHPDFDALYERSTREMDPALRRALFVQMNDLLIADAAVIPLAHLVDFSGISTTLAGVELTPWDVEVWNIKDWRRKQP